MKRILSKNQFLILLVLLVQVKVTTLYSQVCDIVYVSAATGNDANPGTASLPVATLAQALTMTGGTRNAIWMSAGNYTQGSIVNLSNGLMIEGSYAVAGSVWTKSTTQTTSITFSGVETIAGVRHRIAFKADGVSDWQLKDLTITTTSITGTDPSNRGSSNYGIWVNNSSNYTISRCNLTIGNASAGANGTVGANGLNGSNGSQGGSGSCDGNYTCCFGSETAPGGNGGAGGQGAVGIAGGAANSSTSNNNPGAAGTGRNGGGGGAGGKGGGFSGGNNAVAGSAGGGSASQGANNGTGNPGAEGTTGGDGTNGANGLNGASGNTGTAGPLGANVGGYYIPGSQAGTGTDGTGGQGGAGGGGGGRQNGTFVNAGPGNGGAGGGGGGQGATGGTGGFGGGAVFGIYTTSSLVGANIIQNTINLGTAGNGGIGGFGGVGGNGGIGGPRNTTCTSEIGEGGAGGNGGNGGNGGQGGIGANGISSQLSSNGIGSSPSVVIPVNPTVTAVHRGCTNSEIAISSSAGTWTLPTGMNFIDDLNLGQSSYTNSSSNAIVGVSNAGNFTLNLSGTTYENYVGVFTNRPLPVFNSAMQNIVCEGNVFSMSTATPGTQYEWVIIPTSGVTTTPTAIFTTSVASWITPITGITTNYRVRLRTFSNCCGWSVPVYFNFTVVATSVGPIAQGDTICAGEQATLTATGTGSGSLIWYADPLGQIPLQTTVGGTSSFTTTVLNQPNVYYVGEGIGTCLTTLTAVPAFVNQAPLAPQAAPNGNYCAGDSIVLTALGSGGNINWYSTATGGVVLASGSNYSLGVLAAGNYSYYISESNANCTSTRTLVPLTVNSIPAAPTASGTSICSGNSTQLSATGNGLIQWFSDPGLNNLLSTGSVINTGILTTNTNYYINLQAANGCQSASTTVLVTVNSNPGNLVLTSDTICAGQSANLVSSSSGGTINWYSDPTLTNLVGSGTNFNTSILNQNTNFYAVETNSSNCNSNVQAVTVLVNNIPNSPLVTANDICEGDSAIFIASGQTNQLFWYDQLSAGTLVYIGNNFNAGALNAGTYTYYVEEQNGLCISSRTPVVLEVFPKAPTPVVSSATICAGNSALLNATGVGNIYWYSDSTLTTGVATGTIFNTGALGSNQTYYVVAISNNGCISNTSTAQVTVLSLPLSPIVNPDSACYGSSITLTANSVTGNVQWYLDASGNSSVGSGTSFQTPNLFQNVQYFASETDLNGCRSNLVALPVTVLPLPNTLATIQDTVCSGSSSTLTAQGAVSVVNWYQDPAASVLLSSGNSFQTPQLSQNTVYYFSQTDIFGCQSPLTTAQIIVDAIPQAPNALGSSFCSTDSVEISVFGSGFGDIIISDLNGVEISRFTQNGSTSTVFNLGVLNTGNYTYLVSASNGLCNSVGNPVSVSVVSSPAIPVVQNDGPACLGETVFIQANAVQGANYYWTGPNGFSSTNATLMLQNIGLNDAGSYAVVIDVNGCSSVQSLTNLVVYDLPLLNSITSNSPLCEGDSLLLTAPSNLNWIYNWSGPNGFTSSNSNDQILNVTENDHQGFYTLIVTDTNGCSSLPLSLLVDITNLPVVGLAQVNGPICEGSTAILEVADVFGANYSWSGPNGFANNSRIVSISPASQNDQGRYTVEVSRNNCSVVIDLDLIVNPLPSITISPDTTIDQNQDLMIFASGGSSYLWTPLTNLNSNVLQNPIFNATVEGTYTYNVIVTDPNGCSSIDSVVITVVKSDNGLVITDLFTPNGDGVNETWVIDNLQSLGTYTLQIFSRGGLEVYNTNNYANDWDGKNQYSGENLPDGTYYFLIQTETNEYKGAVTIKR